MEEKYQGKCMIGHRVYNQMDKKMDLEGTIKNNFIISDNSDMKDIQEIAAMVYQLQTGNVRR